MAITCSLTLNTYGSLAVPNAYIKVSKAETYKVSVRTNPQFDPETGDPLEPVMEDRQYVAYSAGVYLDAAAREANKNPLDHAGATLEWDIAATPNILSACYAHLKAQDAYAAAQDC